MVVAADPRIPSNLAGYRIDEVLGRGGMGVVYLAQDPWLERKVALKLIAPEFAEDQGFRERFLVESRLAASLEHANVIPIYEAGEADGLLYLAMRYVEGMDLGSLLKEDGRLEPPRALAILEQVAVALDAAHAKGLVHRDVKPGNVLLGGDPRSNEPTSVYLSDFGLTKSSDQDAALTETEQVLGTLDYAAPEQIKGLEVGPPADVYALGCVLYQCLAGEVPYPRDGKLQLAWAHMEEPPPRPSHVVRELPERFDRVIERALAKDPGARFSSCGELVAQARLALGEDGEVASLV